MNINFKEASNEQTNEEKKLIHDLNVKSSKRAILGEIA
jgi:hypothetical protein